MPSKKHQFNVVFDENTESLLWAVAGKLRLSPTQAIRLLIAESPAILSEAEIQGIAPEPNRTKHGKQKIAE